MAPQATVSMAGASPAGPDFGAKPGVYRPGTSPYDSLLPQDYMNKLSEEAREAFKADRFTWGKVPDFVPPLELR
ncbi:hypothetical protein CPB85DRAFT_1331113 [Mucidula mucida]|nr:hypothetical protein CPB85DRAFT_1331113 [Mucidula mucida]